MRWPAYLTGIYSWANFGLWTAVLGLTMLVLWPFDPERRAMARAMHFVWGRAQFWTNPLWTVTRRGEAPGPGPYVVVTNHQSHTDIPNLLGSIPPVRIVARDGIFQAWPMGPFLRLSRQVHQDRFEEEAAAALKVGLSVLVFAEGTRSPDGHLQRFRNGAFEVARNTGVPVLPVVLDGSRTLLAKGDMLPRRALLRVWVAVLPPVDSAAFLSTIELKTAVHESMKQALEAGRQVPSTGHQRRELKRRAGRAMEGIREASVNLGAAERYARVGRVARGIARGKMAGDPAYSEVLPLLEGATSVLDVGCGEGYLLALAADHRPGIALVGVDYDERRLDQGRQALSDVPVQWIAGDARTVDLPQADVVTCLDVLHYQPPADQDAILARLAGAVKPGGTLLLREAVSDEGWRSTATICSERLTIALGRHKGVGVFLRPRAEIEGALAAQGLEVSARSCSQGTPFANWLFVGRRP